MSTDPHRDRYALEWPSEPAEDTRPTRRRSPEQSLDWGDDRATDETTPPPRPSARVKVRLRERSAPSGRAAASAESLSGQVERLRSENAALRRRIEELEERPHS